MSSTYRAAVEEIADVELLQVLVAVELLVVGVGDGIELGLVLRGKHGLGVAPEIEPVMATMCTLSGR
jgi:hypothetical protein